jgi:nucleoid-associated protein YgaU
VEAPVVRESEPREIESGEIETEPEEHAAVAPVPEVDLEPETERRDIPLALETVDYSDDGDIVFSGRADPGSIVRVHVDNRFVGETTADADGRWAFAGRNGIAPGRHTLRADLMGATGNVVGRIILPFVRADGREVAALVEARRGAVVRREPQAAPAVDKPEPAEAEAEPEPEAPVMAEEVAPEPEPEAPAVVDVAPEAEPEAPVVAEEVVPEPQPEAPVVAEETAPEPEPETPVVSDGVMPEPEPEAPVVAEEVAPEPKSDAPAIADVAPEPEPEASMMAEEVGPEPEPEAPVVAGEIVPEPEPEAPVAAEEVAPEPEPETPVVADDIAPEPEPESDAPAVAAVAPEVPVVVAPEPELEASVVADDIATEPETVMTDRAAPGPDAADQVAVAEPELIEPAERDESAAGETAAENGEPEVAAARPGHVVIQPGNNLWRISRVIYGRGIEYTAIYEANRDKIRDPDLIYPGQIFATPGVDPPQEIDPDWREPLSQDDLARQDAAE